MHRPRRHPCSSQRGAALLVAIVAIAVLTALAVDLAYETQVRLRIAANARDDLRAQALAQSAVNLSRLVLGFQSQIDQAMVAACPPQASSGTTGGAVAASLCLRPQIWNLVPVSSALTQVLFADAGAGTSARGEKAGKGAGSPGGDQAEGGAPAFSAASYGDFEGGFQARIEDEAQKINVQLSGLLQTSSMLAPQVDAVLRMICDTRWDPLFDRTDADGQRYSRSDFLVNLRNWVSDDQTSAALTVSFPGGNCGYLVPPQPFEKAFSDKNYPYDRGQDRYKTKNRRMDSVAEMFMVAGVTDAFMAAFGDQLTVFLPNDAAINVNTDDLRQQLIVAALVSDPGVLRVKIADQKFLEDFHKAVGQARMGGFRTITAKEFQDLLQGLGVPPRIDVNLTGAKSAFTDRSTVFRISALGVAGDVTHETEAVVTYDPGQISSMGGTPQATPAQQPAQPQNPQAQQLQQLQQVAAAATGQLNLGLLLHWREN